MKPDRYAILGVLLLAVVVACPVTPPSANLAPSVGIASPDANAIIGSSAVVTLNGPTDPENNPITKIEYTVDGGTAIVLPTTEQGQTFGLGGLTEGNHTIAVKATDDKGNTTTPPLSRVFRVDGTLPVVDPITVNGASTPATPITVSQGANVDVAVNAIDKLFAADAANGGTSTTLLRLRLDGQFIRIVQGGTLTFATKGLSVGNHTFVADAVDRAGNTSTIVSQAVNITEQTTSGKPSLTITPRTAATNGYYKGGSLLEFLWVASDNTATTTFAPSTGTVSIPTTAVLSDLNLWTLPLVSGNYNLKGVAADATTPVPNSSNPVFLNASVDGDPAVVDFTNVTTNQNFNASPVNVSYVATDALSGVRSVTLRAVSGAVSTLVGINSTATGLFRWTPSNGIYSLELTTTDNVGNVSAPAIVSNVIIDIPSPDVTPPTVSIEAATLPNPATGQIAVTALASDPSGVASVTLLVEGTPVATDSASPYIFNLDTTQYQNALVALQVRATDLLGNVSANTTPVSINIVNARRPEFAITSPVNASTLNSLNKVTVNVAKRTTNYQFTSDIIVDVLDYRGRVVATRTIPTSGQPATGPLSLVENTSDIDFNAFPVDAYSIQAKTTIDLAPSGLSTGDGELITQISISNNNQSNQPPALQILSPERLNETQTVLPIFVGTNGIVIADVSDNSGVSSVELRMTCESGCGTQGPVNALQQYIGYIPPVLRAKPILSFNANATPYLPDGNYVLRVVAQDAQGNRNIQEVKARIDRSLLPPTVGILETVIGSNAISENEELCPGAVTYTITGASVNSLFTSWLTSPTPANVRTDYDQTTNPVFNALFTERGIWSFNTQIQERSGSNRIISIGTTTNARSRKITIQAPPLPPIPVPCN